MTICEYIRNEYIKYIETPDNRKGMLINPELKGTYEYFKLFCEYVCGGGYDYQFKKAGITQEQIDKAMAGKYIKKKEYTSWEARMKGQTTLYLLTVKGMKTIYDYYTGKGWQTANPTMSKEVFDKLVSLCNEYDEHIEYIDDGRQYREAERNNRRVKAEFAEIASQYGDMKMPAGAFRFRGAESKESILKKHFEENGFVVND